MTPVEIAQRILDGPWQHAGAAVAACRRGAWREFVRAHAPPRPALFGRADHARCLELAANSLEGPRTVRLALVPLWACSAAEEESNGWVAVHGVAQSGHPMYVQEAGPFIASGDAERRAEAVWECQARRWACKVVAESQFYGPGVELPFRAGAYCVVDRTCFDVLAVEPREADPIQRPTAKVPIFSTLVEPRVRVGAELAAQIRALSITRGGAESAV